VKTTLKEATQLQKILTRHSIVTRNMILWLFQRRLTHFLWMLIKLESLLIGLLLLKGRNVSMHWITGTVLGLKKLIWVQLFST